MIPLGWYTSGSIVTSSFRSIIASSSHRSIVTSPQDPSFRPIAPSSQSHRHSASPIVTLSFVVSSLAASSHCHILRYLVVLSSRHIVTSHRCIIASPHCCSAIRCCSSRRRNCCHCRRIAVSAFLHNWCILILLHYRIVVIFFHRCSTRRIAPSSHCRIATWLHRHVPIRCLVASSLGCIVTSSHRRIIASPLGCIAASSHCCGT